jgi:hypothetical protein
MTTAAVVRRSDWWRWHSRSRATFSGGRSWREPPAWMPALMPRDTMDPRYPKCTAHHLACDCREAEMAENINEYRLMLREWQDAADAILAGHPTRVWAEDGTRTVECQCTGCQIARLAWHTPKTAQEEPQEVRR